MRWNTDRPDPVYMLRPINLPDFDIQKIDPILVRVVRLSSTLLPTPTEPAGDAIP